MRSKLTIICTLSILLFIYATNGKQLAIVKSKLDGAWINKEGGLEMLLLVQDGYYSYTVYNPTDKNFEMTTGGNITVGDKLEIETEYDDNYTGRIGTKEELPYEINGNNLKIDYNGSPMQFTRLDEGKSAMAGVWHITDRMVDGKLTPIHSSGTRKTLKILTDTRFQWVAIDPAAKGFYGTGGGTYNFKDGTYTENIQFFSRDNSRVGASLSFSDKLEGGKWHHTGKSSKGDAIYEVWQKVK